MNIRGLLASSEIRRHAWFSLLLGALVAACYLFVDRPVAVWVRGLDRSTIVVFKKITTLGSSAPYLIVLAVLYPTFRFQLRRAVAAERALFAIAAIVVSGLTVDLLKAIVARWRPIAYFAEQPEYGFAFFKIGYEHNSFPSGHATTVAAVACALWLLCPRLRVLWVSGVILVAASRVVVGAHYPGDVLAGAWFGVVITLLLSRTVWFDGVIEAPHPASRDGDNASSRENPGPT